MLLQVWKNDICLHYTPAHALTVSNRDLKALKKKFGLGQNTDCMTDSENTVAFTVLYFPRIRKKKFLISKHGNPTMHVC